MWADRYIEEADTAVEILSSVGPLYNQEWRHYHNVDHLGAVFERIPFLSETPTNPGALALAVLCHDAIYVPGSSESENASAALLESYGLPDGQEAARLIRITQHHSPDDSDTDAVLLCDADLFELSDPVRYANNATKIHDEVAAYVGDQWQEWIWIEGRKKWLEEFLNRPSIFSGQLKFSDAERQARRNLEEELRAYSGVLT